MGSASEGQRYIAWGFTQSHRLNKMESGHLMTNNTFFAYLFNKNDWVDFACWPVKLYIFMKSILIILIWLKDLV